MERYPGQGSQRALRRFIECHRDRTVRASREPRRHRWGGGCAPPQLRPGGDHRGPAGDPGGREVAAQGGGRDRRRAGRGPAVGSRVLDRCATRPPLDVDRDLVASGQSNVLEE